MEIKIDEKIHEMLDLIWRDIRKDIQTNSSQLYQTKYALKYFFYKKSDVDPSKFESLVSPGKSHQESIYKYLAFKIFGKITEKKTQIIGMYLNKNLEHPFTIWRKDAIGMHKNEQKCLTHKEIELEIEEIENLTREYLKNYEAIMEEEKADINKYNDFKIKEEKQREEEEKIREANLITEEKARKQKERRIQANLYDITAAIRRFNQENMKNEKE